MPAEPTGNVLTGFILSNYFLFFTKAAILLILAIYAIFALIVVRQVDLMGKTFVSKISGTLKAFTIIHMGFVIGLIVLAWGLL